VIARLVAARRLCVLPFSPVTGADPSDAVISLGRRANRVESHSTRTAGVRIDPLEGCPQASIPRNSVATLSPLRSRAKPLDQIGQDVGISDAGLAIG